MKIWFFLSFTFLWKEKVEALLLDPLVNTDMGFIKGKRAADGDYFKFLGIPYARVDKNNPFGAATPEPAYKKIFEANDDSIACPQPPNIINDKYIGTLDCLTLSVFVPYSVLKKKSLPVIVWIFGGQFTFGSIRTAFHGPKFLVKQDVIVVYINFRSNIYGFLCLNMPEVPGNQGLKDQILALKWINKHISSFGGDPHSITVMGESSGSKSADLHLHSNYDILFHRIIMHGGNSYSMLPDLKRDDTEVLLQIAKELGLTTKDKFKALSFLKDINPELVVTVSDKYMLFTPCIEPIFKDGIPFISENPVNLDIPKANNISILVGFCAKEQYLRFYDKSPEYYKTWNGFMDDMNSYFNFDLTQLHRMVKILKKFYLKHQEISYDTRFKLAEFDSDFKILHPTQRIINKYIKNGAKQAYQYMFSYTGGRNFWSLIKPGLINTTKVGAMHAEERNYLFSIFLSDKPNATVTSKDQLIIDRMTTMWTNFAKYGEPTPNVNDLLPVKWKPITKDDLKHYYLNIDTMMSLEKYPFHRRMAFWDLFLEMNKKYLRGYSRADDEI